MGDRRGRWPELDDPEWLQHYWDTTGDPTQMADYLDCPAHLVVEALQDLEVFDWKSFSASLPVHRLHDADWMHVQYVLKRRTSMDIADELGISAQTVLDALKRHGIASRPHSTPNFPELDDGEWLRERYECDMWTQTQIAQHAGCSISSVRKALERNGIAIRPRKQSRFAVDELNDPDWLYNRYIVEHLSTETIAHRLGSSGGTVWRALVKHGIPRRPQPGSR